MHSPGYLGTNQDLTLSLGRSVPAVESLRAGTPDRHGADKLVVFFQNIIRSRLKRPYLPNCQVSGRLEFFYGNEEEAATRCFGSLTRTISGNPRTPKLHITEIPRSGVQLDPIQTASESAFLRQIPSPTVVLWL